ncbi:antibiotic biosynthesis monooxygenase [Pantoea brenneri]|uniref:putative quinol monooxygenase n=1 Tax=Pantoea brenneri TaxID=472694 RepID=UPI00289DEA86|nr:antibiotic biosynthesis monooxygenase [Pantoea brenneri]
MKNISVIFFSLIMSVAAIAKSPYFPDGTIMNIFEFSIKADKSQRYDEIAKETITKSVDQEEGTLAMYSLRHKEDARHAYMIELYKNNQGYQQHINAERYNNFVALAPEIIEKKRQIRVIPQFLGDKHVVRNAETINNLVIVDVKPEFQQAFKKIVLPEMAESIKVEPGVLAMYAATEIKNPFRWYFYEIYASEADYQRHRETPHFRTYIRKTAEMTRLKSAIPVRPVLLRNKGGLNAAQ